MTTIPLKYQDTRREVVTETINGITWQDAYRWLEPESDEALAWDEAENALTDEYLTGWSGYEEISKQLFANPTPSIRAGAVGLFGPQPCGERWLWIKTIAGAYPQLILSDDPLGDGEIVFDPEKMPSHERVIAMGSIYPSPDGRYVVVGTRDAYDHNDPETWGRCASIAPESKARDTQPLKIIDLQTKTLLPVSLEAEWFVRPCWLPDSSGFFYVGTGKPHGRGQEVGVIFSTPEGKISDSFEYPGHGRSLQVSPDGRFVVAIVGGYYNQRVGGKALFKDLHEGGEWTAFIDDLQDPIQGRVVGMRFVAKTWDGTKNGRIVSIPLASATDRSQWETLIGEQDLVAQFVSFASDRLIVGYQDDRGQEIRIYTLDGKPDGKVPISGGGIPASWTAQEEAVVPCTGGFSFQYQGHSLATAHYIFDLTSRALQRFEFPGADLGPLVHRRLEAPATDGAKISIHVVCRPETDLSTPSPLVLSGYGNLMGSFFDPVTQWLPFLDAGGVYAYTNIRGGGEFGVEWWEQGRGLHKGQASLDFCSAAEYLIAQKITAKRRVAITYNSGGGMLTAIALARRPDLFGAAVAIGGITDFMRHERIFALLEEWPGASADAETARANFEWSPYQNVREGEDYPPTLLIAYEPELGWTGQNRKMVAALRHATSSDAPILYRRMQAYAHWDSGPAGGENGPDSFKSWVEAVSFIMANLDMTPKIKT